MITQKECRNLDGSMALLSWVIRNAVTQAFMLVDCAGRTAHRCAVNRLAFLKLAWRKIEKGFSSPPVIIAQGGKGYEALWASYVPDGETALQGTDNPKQGGFEHTFDFTCKGANCS